MSFQLSDHVPQDNFYRRLKDLIDFSFLYKKTSAYYGKEGQKSLDPVVFMKLMLIGYLENINSDRRIVEQSKMRLDILFFLGYNLDEELPWHSTLSRTRQLYGQEVFTEVFRSVLKQCVDKGMVSGRRQAVDGVYVKANASLDSLVEREIMDDIDLYTQELDANRGETKVAVMDIDKNRHSGHGSPPPKKNAGNKTHFSPTDPNAKMSVKPGKAMALNYLGQVSVDTSSHVITHIQAFEANLRDSQCLPGLIGNLVENLGQNGLEIEEIIADKGYSSGEALKALEENNITGYIPNRAQFIYERPGFVYHEDLDCYICPGNQKLVYKGTYETLDGIFNKEYRGNRKTCNGCPLRAECPVYGKRNTVLRETTDRPYYVRMHLRMQTKKAKILMKRRQATVEPVIGTLVNYLGLKKVNTKGLQLANKCMTLSAAAYNIKKLLNHKSPNTKGKVCELGNAFKAEICKMIGHFSLLAAQITVLRPKTLRKQINFLT